jgi:hypothetical protein
MYIAYLDDAGDLGSVANPPQYNDQPAFALTALLVNQSRLSALVPEFLQIKRNFYPGLIPPSSHFLAAVLKEVKGADIRRDIDLPPISHPLITGVSRFWFCFEIISQPS